MDVKSIPFPPAPGPAQWAAPGKLPGLPRAVSGAGPTLSAGCTGLPSVQLVRQLNALHCDSILGAIERLNTEAHGSPRAPPTWRSQKWTWAGARAPDLLPKRQVLQALVFLEGRRRAPFQEAARTHKPGL